MTLSDGIAPGFDPVAVNEKYATERAKRLTATRGVIHDLSDTRFAKYVEDPFTPFVARDPLVADVDVVVVGAGLAGVVVGAKLREAGLGKIMMIDKAGGIGGTWYWSRYPGVMCDLESYIYMPMLEEMNYIPTEKYASGDEIRRHLEAVATKYGLVDDALFHTGVEESRWDEGSRRWVVRTDRGDEVRARYLVMAIGILNHMKLPVIPGMEDFEGKAFHTGRWDYGYTGGAPDDPRMTKLADKVVGVIGTGASAIQAIPPLGESAKHVYAFQRTPSAITWRGNRPTDDEFVEQCRTGWQKERMENFTSVMSGLPVEKDMVGDAWVYMAKVIAPSIPEGMAPEEIPAYMERVDYSIMEEHRKRIEELVADPDVAESLKPYYRYLCKRPLFHDEYYPAFNNPKVTLVDCPAGVTEITANGAIANGVHYELDCIVYATGFEAEATPFPRRAAHPIIGRGGLTMDEKWTGGHVSLHGIATHGFPNMIVMPAPGQQAVITNNYTHLVVMGAEHVAATLAALDERGVEVFEVSEEAETAWTETILSFQGPDMTEFFAACTPSRINHEGHPEAGIAVNGTYGGGLGDAFGYEQLLADWRASGDFAGWDLTEEGSR